MDDAELLKAHLDDFGGLTEWEQNFLESCKRLLDEDRPLSPKQREILQRIYDQRV